MRENSALSSNAMRPATSPATHARFRPNAQRDRLARVVARGGLRFGFQADPEVMRFAALVTVWIRWLYVLHGAVQVLYRPQFWNPDHVEFLLLLPPLLGGNLLLHYRLRRRRSIPARLLLGVHLVDLALISAAVIIGASFDMHAYLVYYPAVALFAVVFSSLRLCMAWTTAVAAIYAAVSIGLGPGINLEEGDEKQLAARILAMYAVAAIVNLIARFERGRRERLAGREQQLLRERVELSQAMHDTAAQTTYLIAMGLQRAERLAEGSGRELTESLAAIAALARTASWELRRPINEGRLFEGRELAAVLWAHVESLSRISSVAAELDQRGEEPPLSDQARARLFAFAHNAMTNVYQHAGASRVDVRLEFDADLVRLSVVDDGVGLPDGYADRGRGFSGMRAAAERLGGRLIVSSNEGRSGTRLTCEAPLKANLQSEQ